MFESINEVRDYCRYVIQCLVDKNYKELMKKGILNRVSEEELKHRFMEYNSDDYISMPPAEYFNEIRINEYTNKSGYWVDIDLFYSDEVSDLTLQLDFRKTGEVLIEDLHVL